MTRDPSTRAPILTFAFSAALAAAPACGSKEQPSAAGPTRGAAGGVPGGAAGGGQASVLGGATAGGAGPSGGQRATAGTTGNGASAGSMNGGSSADNAGEAGELGTGGSESTAGGDAGAPASGVGGAESPGGSGQGGASLGGRGAAGSSTGSGAGSSAGTTTGAGKGGGASGAAGTSSGDAGMGSGGGAGTGAGTTGAIDYAFVITMENHDTSEIIGNGTDAPYINDTLLPSYAQSSSFTDQFALSVPSEPHYIWMEAGTNVFSDHTFSTNGVPSASNSTSDTNHLVTQLTTAGISWMSYQEDIDATAGACPIAASGQYHPRHNPVVFFQDVAGNPPSKTNAYCAAHHKNFDLFAADLAAETVARYNFITPNLCDDMHGNTGCPSGNLIRRGDDWLAANLPGLISFVTARAGVIFIVWDEGDATATMPFIAVGPGVKAGYTGGVSYNHGSLVKSLELIFDVPVSSRVSAESDLSDLFKSGFFP